RLCSAREIAHSPRQLMVRPPFERSRSGDFDVNRSGDSVAGCGGLEVVVAQLAKLPGKAFLKRNHDGGMLRVGREIRVLFRVIFDVEQFNTPGGILTVLNVGPAIVAE